MRFFERRQGLVRPWQMVNGSLLFSGVLLGLVGCAPDFSSSERQAGKQNSDKVHGEVTGRKSAVAAINFVGKSPHRYAVTISWPEGFSQVSIYLGKKKIFTTESKTTDHFDYEVDDNSEHIFRLEVKRTPIEQAVILSKWTVTTPIDFVLTNKEVASLKDTSTKIHIQAHRVFIPAALGINPSFYTLGKDLIIDTDELISDDGLIATFPKDQKAPLDTNGRDGGQVTIKAKVATGSLGFIPSGENGGDGTNGEPYSDRAPNGTNGIAADYTFRCQGINEQVCTCDPKTAARESGQPGQKGNSGRNGSNGGRGGNSAIIKIEVSTPSPQFQVEIFHQEGGRAGVPGKAGPPQKGGVGGKPWTPPDTIWTRYHCKNRSNGRDGDDGDPGQDGIQQLNGKVGMNCVTNGEGFGRCP